MPGPRVAIASLRLPEDLASARQAREFIRVSCTELVCCDDLDRLLLLTNELVTNVLVHARTWPETSIHRALKTVIVGVSDDGLGHPVMRAPALHSGNGQGLYLLSQLADNWGIERDGLRKTVWFAVPEANAACDPEIN